MEKLNDLQRRVERRIDELVSESGRSIDRREILEAEVPFYSDQPFWLLKLKVGDLEMWVYDDEISFSAAARGGGLELADYADEDQFVEAVAERVKMALA